MSDATISGKDPPPEFYVKVKAYGSTYVMNILRFVKGISENDF